MAAAALTLHHQLAAGDPDRVGVCSGRRCAVAEIRGLKFSGFLAWWLWRTIYLAKLPRLEKKVRVALDWTLDMLFAKDLVQFGTRRAPVISRRETLALMREEPVNEVGTISATASL